MTTITTVAGDQFGPYEDTHIVTLACGTQVQASAVQIGNFIRVQQFVAEVSAVDTV